MSASKTSSTKEIDESCKHPVGFLLSKSIGWLFLAVVLEVCLAIKLVFPEFLNQCSWMSFGRLDAAASSVFWYGFALQAGLGMAFWLLCRLGRNTLESAGGIFIGFGLYNFAVLVGVVGILAGDSTGIPGLEMPVYGSLPLLISYILLAGCVVVNFNARNKTELYATQWFVLGSVLWFPWILSIAQYLTFFASTPVEGPMQGVVGYWFSRNLEIVVGGSIALGTLYYLVPKISGNTSVNASLAKFSFWGLVVIGGWGGVPMGAPFPAWYTTLGVIGALLIAVPVATAVASLIEAVDCKLSAFGKDATLRWAGIALASLCVTVGLGVLMTIVKISRITSMTYVELGVEELYQYGFIAAVVIGATGYVFSNIYGVEPKGTLSKAMAPLTLVGLGVSFVGLLVGGIMQGLVLNIAEAPFAKVAAYSTPFLYLHLGGLLLFALGQLGNVVNVTTIVFTKSIASCCSPKTAEDSSEDVESEAIGAEA